MAGRLLQLLVIGISMGMIYAFIAMGVILLVRAVGVMNFAQGDILMLGAFVSFSMLYGAKLPLFAAIIAMMLIFVVFAIVFMFTVYWPLKKAPWPAAIVISTLGASIVIKEGATFLWGNTPKPMDPIIRGSLVIGNTRLEYQYLIIIVVGVLIIAGIYLLFEKLYAGRMMQAAAQDSYAAQIIGIPTIVTTLVTFVISMLLSGVGGFLVAPLFLVSTSLGALQLKAFAGIVIGGFGNIKGAVLGSIIVGLIESFATLFTSTYKDAIVFAVLIIFLVVRPQGIYGEKISEKA